MRYSLLHFTHAVCSSKTKSNLPINILKFSSAWTFKKKEQRKENPKTEQVTAQSKMATERWGLNMW
jgi:hypothetical protein